MAKILRILLATALLLTVAFAASMVWRAQRSRAALPSFDLESIARSGVLPPCPEWPNCVSSQASDPPHAIAPFALDGEPSIGLARLTAAAEGLGARVIERRGPCIHLEFRTPLLGFADDLLLVAVTDAAGGAARVDVRSASRVGQADLGANRRRVEELRRAAGGR